MGVGRGEGGVGWGRGSGEFGCLGMDCVFDVSMGMVGKGRGAVWELLLRWERCTGVWLGAGAGVRGVWSAFSVCGVWLGVGAADAGAGGDGRLWPAFSVSDGAFSVGDGGWRGGVSVMCAWGVVVVCSVVIWSVMWCAERRSA